MNWRQPLEPEALAEANAADELQRKELRRKDLHWLWAERPSVRLVGPVLPSSRRPDRESD